MIKLSANYSYTNHNFVIQNLDIKERVNNEYLPAVCILKNILQRGKPTLMSSFLQSKIGPIHREADFKTPRALIDRTSPKWQRIIRGDVKNNYNPASKFFDELIPKYFSKHPYIQQLILPEVPINEITKVDVDEFAGQQVDFYLPQAYLIIEIDSSSHDSEVDAKRDAHTSKYGIKTIRIKTKDLETENAEFLKVINEIIERIEEINNNQAKRKEGLREKGAASKTISLNDYKVAYNNIDLNDPSYLATAVIRFQLTILSLLEIGYLVLNDQVWTFEIYDHDITGYAEIAIEDLMIWFTQILQLQKVEFRPPTINVKRIDNEQGFSVNEDAIRLNFSLLKRYTDEFQANENIIYVRNDYLDKYKYFKKGDSRGKLEFVGYHDYDYFKVSTTETVKYKLIFDEKNSDEQPLKFLLWNIFLQSLDALNYDKLSFNEGQLPVIASALSRSHTIGLLPTGSGKSVCFQLAAILQPAISFVVCPIKSLMYDQEADLEAAYFTRIGHITSDDDADEKDIMLKNFSDGRLIFIYISPERFQIKAFRDYLKVVSQPPFNIAYAVIDEVHCLSEWGHDFRTAYLNLANTIHSLCPDSIYIGLTATASINVIKDIKVEFKIQDENVKTPSYYSREELEFYVKEDNGAKYQALLGEIKTIDSEMDILNATNGETKCGIIFTQTVGGKKMGCYHLSQELTKDLGFEVGYFSGSVPKINKIDIMSNEEHQKYKINVQNRFKHNELKLITATKAFGMGINKSNIYYTIHYGIPQSMEALYQEAGRAGRDKKKFLDNRAKCCVLLAKSTRDENFLNKLWAETTMFPELTKLCEQVDGDISTNLFLFTQSWESVKMEGDLIFNILSSVCRPNAKGVVINGRRFDVNKGKAEKAIYRLSQLGVITDWTVKNFFDWGQFEVDCADFNEETIHEALNETTRKYGPDDSLETLSAGMLAEQYNKIINLNSDPVKKDIYLLLLWAYNKFANNRRQSLKNIYENCCKVADGQLTREEFKKSLEDYFKFTGTSSIFQEIAESPVDYQKWFTVFYDANNGLVTLAETESLKNNLSRFLESYVHNTGLNLISGLLRLLLDDYNNADGRSRLESSLQKIKDYELQDRKKILDDILKIGKQLDIKNTSNLAESLCKYFKYGEFLITIHTELNDEHTAYHYIKDANARLKDIRGVLYGRLK